MEKILQDPEYFGVLFFQNRRSEKEDMMDCHEKYMERALKLARTAMGHTSPNPMVGCVVVKDGNIVAEGCHEKYGGFHAERNALTQCTEDVTGADLYVTLEPCCHQGKTPPCTDIIIEKKIGRVFVGAMDPNPKVAGNGVKLLREYGLEVVTGVREAECLAINEIFFHYIQSGMPYVAMKYAMTLDGKIASCTGDSKWVTGEKAREHVQLLRKKYSSIMVGVDTVIADDPMLNCRMWEGVDPVRVICDTHLRIPAGSQIVRTAERIRTIVAYAGEVEEQKKLWLTSSGVELMNTGDGCQVSMKELFARLGRQNIDSVLVEGGGSIHGSLLETGFVNRIYAYIAPKLIGGESAKSPVEGNGIREMSAAKQLSDMTMFPLGDDLCVTGRL